MYILFIIIILLLLFIIFQLFYISKQLKDLDTYINTDISQKFDDIHSELFPYNSYESNLYKQLNSIREDMCERK